jgi:hypothetical protein
MKSKFVLSTVALICLGAASPVHHDAWAKWRDGLARSCPARHVDRMGDGAYDEFLGAFHRTLSRNEQRQMQAYANYTKLCTHEQNGFACEMSINLEAAQRLGLLNKMVSFGCRTVRCEEGALCSSFPKTPQNEARL